MIFTANSATSNPNFNRRSGLWFHPQFTAMMPRRNREESVPQEEADMDATTVAVDLAKDVFQVALANRAGRIIERSATHAAAIRALPREAFWPPAATGTTWE
jgi:hypothetical protein